MANTNDTAFAYFGRSPDVKSLAIGTCSCRPPHEIVIDGTTFGEKTIIYCTNGKSHKWTVGVNLDPACANLKDGGRTTKSALVQTIAAWQTHASMTPSSVQPRQQPIPPRQTRPTSTLEPRGDPVTPPNPPAKQEGRAREPLTPGTTHGYREGAGTAAPPSGNEFTAGDTVTQSADGQNGESEAIEAPVSSNGADTTSIALRRLGVRVVDYIKQQFAQNPYSTVLGVANLIAAARAGDKRRAFALIVPWLEAQPNLAWFKEYEVYLLTRTLEDVVGLLKRPTAVNGPAVVLLTEEARESVQELEQAWERRVDTGKEGGQACS